MQPKEVSILLRLQSAFRKFPKGLFIQSFKSGLLPWAFYLLPKLLSRVPHTLRLVPFIIIILVSLTFNLLPAPGHAAQVTLAWDKSPESDIVGYKIHYGIISGNYDYSVNIGNYTSCNISGLEENTTYYFAATAYNAIGESDFSEEIVYSVSFESDPSSDPDPSTDLLSEIIIDNGNAGTFFTGKWRISRSPNSYGDDSLYSREQGARYNFETILDGSYLVSLWWTANSTNRCSRVPVEIYDGDTRIAAVEVNQQTNGEQWNELGEYSFNGTARVTVVSTGSCITGVDAVEFASYEAPELSIYQITAAAGSGGIISPAGEATVSAGASAIYTIQADTYYHIADVKVDGNSVGAVTSYTFKDVTADHAITASFDADTIPPESGKSGASRKWWRRR